MTNHLHRGDLPSGVVFKDSIAVDTETMGLRLHRDRLCVVQISDGGGDAHLVQIIPGTPAKYLAEVLSDPKIEKIFHFARFDLVMLQKHLGVKCMPVYCTRTASRLVRTNTDKHGLKDLCKDLIGVEISKQQQSSDWAAETLTKEQIDYAASDVLYLHKLQSVLELLLEREGRKDLADACFKFLPERAALDLAGWADEDIFAHS
ncbi:MAG: ribonuclease D [Candidatus Marinimicrobia bacterium]|nr:ribonuclease D [Candidatus Neomarinimicrobiota bacterium]